MHVAPVMAFTVRERFEKAGIPVIAPPFPGVLNLITNGFDGLLRRAEKPLSLARGIEQILDDCHLAEIFAATGLSKAAELHWAEIASQYGDVYRSLVYRDPA